MYSYHPGNTAMTCAITRAVVDTRFRTCPLLPVVSYFEYSAGRIEVGAIDAAALGPFKK